MSTSPPIERPFPLRDGRGDISRDSFDSAARFESVRLQQGRPLLDADWNEQVDLIDYRLRAMMRDLAGVAATSDPDLVRIDGSTLLIGPGRIWIDGALAELPVALEVPLELPGARPAGRIVYLDVRVASVSAPLEPALDGLETAVRGRVVVEAGAVTVGPRESIRDAWSCAARAWRSTLRLQPIGDTQPGVDTLMRVEVHATGPDGVEVKWSRDNALPLRVLRDDGQRLVLARGPGTPEPGDAVELVDRGGDPLIVESVHAGRNPGEVEIGLVARREGDGVAYVRVWHPFDLTGRPVLAKVPFMSAEAASAAVGGSAVVTANAGAAAGAASTAGAALVASTASAVLPLANGVKVRFEYGGPPRANAGEAWLIPVRRAAPNGVIWPREGDALRAIAPTAGRRLRVPVAMCHPEPAGWQFNHHFRLLKPLGGLEPPEAQFVGGRFEFALDGDIEGAAAVDVRVSDGRLHGVMRVKTRLADGAVDPVELARAVRVVPADALLLGAPAVKLVEEAHETLRWTPTGSVAVRPDIGPAPPAFDGTAGRLQRVALRTRMAWISEQPEHQVATFGDRIVVLARHRLWVWSPEPGQWRHADLEIAEGAALAVGGRTLHVIGGLHDRAPSRAHQVFTIGSDGALVPEPGHPDLPAPTTGAAACAFADRVVVSGGVRDRLIWPGTTVCRSTWRYDLESKRWLWSAPMRTARVHHALIVAGHRVFAIGGRAGEAQLSSVEAYDPDRDRWSRRASLRIARQSPTLVDDGGAIVALGGQTRDTTLNGAPIATAEVLSTPGGVWGALPQAPLRLDVNAFTGSDTPSSGPPAQPHQA